MRRLRAIKQKTVNEQYPVARIDDICTDLDSAPCFVSLEGLTGYRHIRVRVEARPKTAFFTNNGLFVFNLMAFSLANATPTFQCLLDRLLSEPIGEDIAAYLADILMHAS